MGCISTGPVMCSSGFHEILYDLCKYLEVFPNETTFVCADILCIEAKCIEMSCIQRCKPYLKQQHLLWFVNYMDRLTLPVYHNTKKNCVKNFSWCVFVNVDPFCKCQVLEAWMWINHHAPCISNNGLIAAGESLSNPWSCLKWHLSWACILMSCL